MWLPLTDTVFGVRPAGKTTEAVGALVNTGVANPSWPQPLYPQHLSSSLSRMAHPKATLNARSFTVRPAPKSTLGPGSSLSTVSPKPSPPSALLPQHFTLPVEESTHVLPFPGSAFTAIGVRQVPVRQIELTQSSGIEQRLVSAQRAVQEPPQSMSVSLAFFTPSVQEGAAQRPPEHTPLPQSEPSRQTLDSAHRLGHAPPQSTSLSVPFRTRSSQVAATHFEPVHTSLLQSSATAQPAASAHLVAHEPPQSISVSEPFFMPSAHVGPPPLDDDEEDDEDEPPDDEDPPEEEEDEDEDEVAPPSVPDDPPGVVMDGDEPQWTSSTNPPTPNRTRIAQ